VERQDAADGKFRIPLPQLKVHSKRCRQVEQEDYFYGRNTRSFDAKDQHPGLWWQSAFFAQAGWEALDPQGEKSGCSQLRLAARADSTNVAALRLWQSPIFSHLPVTEERHCAFATDG
jgi:hypothetical protein